MKILRKCLLIGLSLWLLLGSLQCAGDASFLFSCASIRFEQDLEIRQIEQLRSAVENSGDGTITFWSERSGIASNAQKSLRTQLIAFDGDANLAYPAVYKVGSAPVMWSPDTCALSANLAWELWGSVDVLGLELIVEDIPYRVVGVFGGSTNVLLHPGNDNFCAADLQLENRDLDSYSYAQSLVRTYLGTASCQIIWGRGFSDILLCMPWICIFVEAIALFLALGRIVRKTDRWKRTMIEMLLMLALALGIPAALECLPSWLIPTKWSDFDFWVRLFETLKERLQTFLEISPRTRDVAAKIFAIKTIAASLFAAILVAKTKPPIYDRKSNS